MKFSEQWLREWVNPPVPVEQLASQLTMLGLEVDAISKVAKTFTQVIVGKIISVEMHSDAEYLSICYVDIGQKDLLTIVCGASNVRPGLCVAVATIGATIEPDIQIKASVIRGVASAGMLCSAQELGLTELSDDILELDADAPLGTDLFDYLNLHDAAIEVDLTPNRGDCLSIQGIAREVGVVNKSEVTTIDIKNISAVIKDSLAIELQVPEACSHYVGRIIRQINPLATSPMWLKERLRRSGLRSISPVVDVTNYVMLELGQPMHAFDLDKIDSSIVVRKAKKSEKLTLLDEQEVELDDTVTVIADKSKALAIAGIMGSLETAVNDQTHNIFLESAFFPMEAIAGKARKYGLSTDSSHRFERGVSPNLQVPAIERATELLLAIVGGKPGPINQVTDETYLPVVKTINLRPNRITRVLGIEIETQALVETFQRLGMSVQSKQDSLQIVVPSFRFDIQIEEDLIEEVARIYGYNQLPTYHLQAELTARSSSELTVNEQKIYDLFVARGYNEVINYSFVDPQVQEAIEPKLKAVNLLNPISQELSQMRTSLWSGLIANILYNQHRQMDHMKLFESGLCFMQDETTGELKQQKMLAGLIVGKIGENNWNINTRTYDFYDIKADLQAAFALTKDSTSFQFVTGEHSALHPRQSAHIYRNGELLGWAGALHPGIQEALDIEGPVFLFQLYLNQLQQAQLPHFRSISKFPSIKRDIALIVDDHISSQELINTINSIGGSLIQSVDIFDVYKGENIAKGKKSIAISLTLQHSSHTFKDSEVVNLMENIVSALGQAYGTKLRN